MKERFKLATAILANASLFGLCFFSRFDIIPLIIFLPVLHVLIFILNLYTAKRWWQVILLNAEHLAATVGTIILDGRLYYQHVSDDLETLSFHVISVEIGLAITVIFFFIHIVVFRFEMKSQRKSA